MAIPSTAGRRLSLLFRRPSPSPPPRSSASAASPSPPPASFSLAAALSRLRYELDPDKAVSIISSPSSTAGRRLSLLFRRPSPSPPPSSSASAASPSPPPASFSLAAAKSRLRYELDPDKAVSITFDQFIRARRTADIEALIDSRKQEPFLANRIHAYGAAGMHTDALSLFEQVPTLCSAPPTVISFNAVLSAFMLARKSSSVPHLFAQLSNDHSIVPNAVSYGILVKSLCRNENSVDALKMLNEMEDKGVKPTVVVYTTILRSLYKEGKAEEAEKLWSEMVGKGCVPDLSAYNDKAMYKSVHGTPEEVEAVIREIKSAGRKPDTVTYNYLITSYCRNGWFEDAKGIYKWHYKKGVPNAATFTNFLQFLCENGDIDAGLEVFNDAVTRNRIPDFPATSLLVEGLVKGPREQEAKAVIGEVKKRLPRFLSVVGGEVELSEKSLRRIDLEKKLCLVPEKSLRWIDLEKKLGLVEEAEISDKK